MPVTADNLQDHPGMKDSPRRTISYQSGNVARLDVPIPFFMRNDVFTTFSKEDYSWTSGDGGMSSGGGVLQKNVNPRKMMVLFARIPEAVRRVVEDGSGESVPIKGNLEEQYSIGGCPLECPFDLNEDFDEALYIDELPTVFAGLKIPSKYERLTIDDGNWAIRQASAQMEPFVREINLVKDTDGWPEDDTPVFSLVDGTNVKSGVTLKGFRWKLQSLHMHCMGKWPPEAPILTVEAFRKYHDQNLNVENKPMTSVAHSIYEKLHGEYPSRGKVFMEFTFKEPVGVFELPPEDCLSKIAIQPKKGDANPSMSFLWKEIEELERWIILLSKCSEYADADATGFLNSSVHEFNEDKLTENIKAIQELLIQEPAIDLHRASSTEYSDSLDSVLARVIKLERADCDFTDRIWSVVKSCEGVEELQECLQVVFKAVSNKMYRPYLLPENETGMARNLMAVMKGNLRGLLEMRKPNVMVEAVIECGLVKLFKDYNFALAMSHLIERGDVQYFAPSTRDFSSSLENLKKLHCILEVMCLSKERLTLSVNIQVGHVKKLLNTFSNSQPLNWNEAYHFDVPPNDIRRVMTGLHPIYFKAKMKSKTLLKWAETSVVVSPESYISHQRREENNDATGRQYYVYVFAENGRLGKNKERV